MFGNGNNQPILGVITKVPTAAYAFSIYNGAFYDLKAAISESDSTIFSITVPQYGRYNFYSEFGFTIL